MPRIGALDLSGAARSTFFLSIGTTGSPVPQKSLIWIHAAFERDAAWAGLQNSTHTHPEVTTTPGFDINHTLSAVHRRFAFARLSRSYLTGSCPAVSTTLSGTPQGRVISPLLANLFLHYAFDQWMDRENPDVPFERYADDIICHCRTEAETQTLWRRVQTRLSECGLALHPQKTKIVYCKDTNRKGRYPTVAFDFLGYRFQPRLAVWCGGLFGVSYLPAASPKALKTFRRRVRNWGLQRQGAH